MREGFVVARVGFWAIRSTTLIPLGTLLMMKSHGSSGSSVMATMQLGALISIVSSAVAGKVVEAESYFRLIGAAAVTGIVLGAVIGLVLDRSTEE